MSSAVNDLLSSNDDRANTLTSPVGFIILRWHTRVALLDILISQHKIYSTIFRLHISQLR